MNTLASAIKILSIRDTAIDLVTIKSAYRSLIGKWHPDRFQGDEAILRATAMAKRINIAYELLTEHVESNGPIHIDSGNVSGFDKIVNPRHSYSTHTFSPGFPDASVFEVFMKSSNVLSAGYNETSHTLFVKFKNGSVYEYLLVPIQVWNDFRNAESHGSYASKFTKYKYRRCHEPNKPYAPKTRIT